MKCFIYWYGGIKIYDIIRHLDFISLYKPDFCFINKQRWICYFVFTFVFTVILYLRRFNQFCLILRNVIEWSANCWNYRSHGITFFRFVGFYDSTQTWWNRIRRIKLEISSSFKLLLLTKSCKVFLDFTCKCRCWAIVTDSPICSSIFCMASLLLRIAKPMPLS